MKSNFSIETELFYFLREIRCQNRIKLKLKLQLHTDINKTYMKIKTHFLTYPDQDDVRSSSCYRVSLDLDVPESFFKIKYMNKIFDFKSP